MENNSKPLIQIINESGDNKSLNVSDLDKEFNELLISKLNNPETGLEGLFKSLELLKLTNKTKQIIIDLYKINKDYEIEKIIGLNEEQIQEIYILEKNKVTQKNNQQKPVTPYSQRRRLIKKGYKMINELGETKLYLHNEETRKSVIKKAVNISVQNIKNKILSVFK